MFVYFLDWFCLICHVIKVLTIVSAGLTVYFNLCSTNRGGRSGTASKTMAVLIFEANNYGCGILWVCFLMSMRSEQRGLITEYLRLRSCNFIVDWTIVLGKVSIAGLALATSQLIQLTVLSVHINLDQTSFFQKYVWDEMCRSGIFQHSWF